MTGVIEAAGDMGMGAAWARAAEPDAGEAHARGHGACLNCGAALAGRYCHACGQSSHVHRTLMSIVHDLAHGVFHFEGKIWRTVPMLVLHPGQLTRRYIAGERARYVSPLALFLFTVFLMFATYSAVGPGDLSKGFAEGWSKSAGKLDAAQADSAREMASLEAERARLLAAGQPTLAIDHRLRSRREDAAALIALNKRLSVGSTPGAIDVHSSSRWLDAALKKARADPGLTIYKVQSAAYKFSWVLIFLSTPFVALMFLWRRRYGLYDHATFVTYSISFMSLLAIVLELLLAVDVPGWLLAPLFLLAPPVHMFAQLKGAYALTTVSALWRTVLLVLFAIQVLAMFVLGVVVLEVSH